MAHMNTVEEWKQEKHSLGVIEDVEEYAAEGLRFEETEERADGGVLVFDNSPLPPDGNDPALAAADTEHGRYARVAQM
ncbi:hypothetical protein BRC79_01770 [Halobacteriales archaeon QH_8_67_27]|nr:MAG: hypothetical protein BRC79_01770 [Halobacteriales archaeon QH_8_67_27]